MNNFIIPFLIICLTVLIYKLFEKNECDHAHQTYYDAAGDELPGDQSEACFSECVKCGKKFVIPSGFQSDSHFEHFLYEREQVSSKNHNKKNKNDN